MHPLIAPIISLVSLVIVSLIGVVWKLRDRELVDVVSDMKSVLQNQARLLTQMEQLQRDIAAMAGHENRITALDGNMRDALRRLDRHGDDIDTTNNRIDHLQGLINNKPKRSTGDAGGL